MRQIVAHYGCRAHYKGYAWGQRTVSYHGMKRIETFAVAVFTCCFALNAALAGPAFADDVVVHGTQASGFSSKARVEDAPREVTDVASLIEPLPGVHVRRFGAEDGFSTLSIRGSSSSEVAVILAGVPLTGGADPTLDLATLPLWPGARARVFRSFAPASVGPGSLGGTLILDAPSATGPDLSEVWAAAGAFGVRRMRVGHVGTLGGTPASADGARFATAFSASRSDDDFSYYDSLASKPGSDSFAARENAGHAAVNGLTSIALPVRWAAGNVGRLTITALAQARKQRIPGTVTLPEPFQQLDSNREVLAMELSGPVGHGSWSARSWARRDNLRILDDARAATRLGNPTHTDDAILASGASLGWRGQPTPSVTLEARTDGSGERFAPGTWEGASPPPRATRVNAGVAADLEWRVTPAWTWSASGRADAWSDSASASERNVATSRTVVRPTGHIGTELREGPFAVAAHGGALSRAPSFVERYGNHGSFIGDENLRPESAWTLDLGARADSKVGPVALHAELVGFATWAEELIVFVNQGAYGRAKATNIGQARLRGIEAAVGGRAYGFDLRASYTGLLTANGSECAVASGVLRATCDRPPLPGRPEHDLVTDLSYALGPARIRYGIDALSGTFADNVGAVQVPARVLHSAGARLEVPGLRGLHLALDVRNMFDLRVATYAGVTGPAKQAIGDAFEYPLPGRSVLLSARYTVER